MDIAGIAWDGKEYALDLGFPETLVQLGLAWHAHPLSLLTRGRPSNICYEDTYI